MIFVVDTYLPQLFKQNLSQSRNIPHYHKIRQTRRNLSTSHLNCNNLSFVPSNEFFGLFAQTTTRSCSSLHSFIHALEALSLCWNIRFVPVKFTIFCYYVDICPLFMAATLKQYTSTLKRVHNSTQLSAVKKNYQLNNFSLLPHISTLCVCTISGLNYVYLLYSSKSKAAKRLPFDYLLIIYNCLCAACLDVLGVTWSAANWRKIPLIF